MGQLRGSLTAKGRARWAPAAGAVGDWIVPVYPQCRRPSGASSFSWSANSRHGWWLKVVRNGSLTSYSLSFVHRIRKYPQHLDAICAQWEHRLGGSGHYWGPDGRVSRLRPRARRGLDHNSAQDRVLCSVMELGEIGRIFELSYPWRCKLTEGRRRCPKILPRQTLVQKRGARHPVVPGCRAMRSREAPLAPGAGGTA